MSDKNKIKQYYIISRKQYCFILYKKMNSYGVVKGLKNYDFDQMREEIRKRNEQREEDEENAEFAMS